MNIFCKAARESRFSLAVYTLSHLAVDMGCFYILFASVKPSFSASAVSAVFLAYNAVAFALQPLAGLLADRRPNLPLGVCGAALVCAALLFSAAPLLSAGVCALGNALFHVAGGRDSLLRSRARLARPALFVSSGALGVALGTYLGNASAPLIAALLPTAACLALLCLVELPAARGALRLGGDERDASAARYEIASQLPLAALLALPLAAIAVRSYVGFIVPMEWKTTPALAFVPALAAFAGKAAGGIAADRLGARRTACIALVLSVPALCLGAHSAAVCALGLFFFNMAMPVSLCVVASALPNSPGLAFGMTTLALFVGSVPAFFFAPADGVRAALIIALTLAAALCSYLSTNNRRIQ